MRGGEGRRWDHFEVMPFFRFIGTGCGVRSVLIRILSLIRPPTRPREPCSPQPHERTVPPFVRAKV